MRTVKALDISFTLPLTASVSFLIKSMNIVQFSITANYISIILLDNAYRHY